MYKPSFTIKRSSLSGPEWETLRSLAFALSLNKERTFIDLLLERSSNMMQHEYGKFLVQIIWKISELNFQRNHEKIASIITKSDVDNEKLVIDDIRYIFYSLE